VRREEVYRRLLFGLASSALLVGCLRPEPPPPAPPVVQEAPPPERWIRVRKTEHTLTLYEGTEPMKTYAVVLGKDPLWAKLYEGDQRTPEGEYHIVKKYYHPFWSRFMLLDYPTPRNRELYDWSRARGLLPERGRSVPGIGGAVGIHGTEDEGLNRRGVNWTAGCVSLFNHDVDELYDLVPVGTRVLIER
jgi:murein L,D-transpeptidase YafK